MAKKIVVLQGEITKIAIARKKKAVITFEVPTNMAHLVPIDMVTITIEKRQQEMTFEGKDE